MATVTGRQNWIESHFNENSQMHEHTTIEFCVRIMDRKNLNGCTPFPNVSLWLCLPTLVLVNLYCVVFQMQ